MVVVAVGGCNAVDPKTSGETPRISYFGDVKPVIDARCNDCHGQNAIAPFPLTTYEEVEQVGPLLAVSVGEKTMPPWQADNACASYKHDSSLSPVEIDLVVAWVDGGMEQGDPAEEPEPLPRSRVHLDRRDVHLSMAESHVPQPPEGSLDEHYCFVLDWPGEQTQYITGYETLPGNRKVLHHFIGVIIAPELAPVVDALDAQTPAYGFDCGPGTGTGTGLSDAPVTGFSDAVRLFAAWVPGAPPVIYPEGTGVRIEPGSKILLDMHYNVVAGDFAPDQTAFDFQVEPTVEREGRSMFIADERWLEGDNMLIPAGQPSVFHGADVDLAGVAGGPLTLYHAGLHMHELGASARLGINRADGSSECLLDIPSWDFDWQLNYQLTQPTFVDAGDQVRIDCEWDNSAANQPMLNGEIRSPVDVAWGDDTYDEMCLGLVYVTRR